MDKQQFQQLLASNGSYDTDIDADQRTIVDRLTGWSDLCYYIGLFRTIYASHQLAKRGYFLPDAWAEHSFRVLQTVEACGGNLHISGMELLTKTNKPVVYVANHMGMLETLLFPSILLHLNYVAMVVKQSLTTYPIFGDVMLAVNPIALNRTNPREDLKKVMTMGKKFLSQGRSVIIFPQSTRSRSMKLEKFNSIGAKLAYRANVPLVPIALKTDFQETGRIIKDLGRIKRNRPIYFKFGAPIKVEKNNKIAHEQALSFIKENLVAWSANDNQ